MTREIFREVSEDGYWIVVEFEFRKGTSDYFSKSFGNWLPGDPDEFNILSACRKDNGEPVALTPDEELEIEGFIPEAIRDAEEAAAEAQIEAYQDRMEGWD